jgi:Protein of unknown function (DUF1822)
MTYSNNDLTPENDLWNAVEAETMELELKIPDGPLLPVVAVPMPIASTAREKATAMANLCPNPAHRETLRRYLLATIVLHDYLTLQGYLPDLSASDCWNPILGRSGEGADLVVSQVGRLECCVLEPGQPKVAVLPEGQFGRAGYVAVELDAQEHWGWLLGFVPGGDSVTPVEELHRDALISMDELGAYLQRLWLLWSILQESAEPWEAELRSEMVALLERTYRLHSPAQWTMRAVAEMTGLVGAVRRSGDSPDNGELRHYLRSVFDRLEETLAVTEEADNGRSD